MTSDENSTLTTVSEQGQMLIPAHVLKALGIATNGKVALRIVQRGDHFIAEIEEASLAARSRNEAADKLGKALLERMTTRYGTSPKRDAMADERGES